MNRLTVSRADRLMRIEEMARSAGVCPECLGYPVRTVYLDPETNAAWQESIPADGCPECGTAVYNHIEMVKANNDQDRGAQ